MPSRHSPERKSAPRPEWYARTIAAALDAAGSNENGITDEDAAKRLIEYGENRLPEAKRDSLPAIFLRQFQNPLIYILVAASAIVFVIGERTDAMIILAVLVFNAIVGTIQEGRAQNTLSALKKFVETNTTVVRSGREIVIPDYETVPGDMLALQEGDKVPADARIIATNNLRVDEAALTGESEPVQKTSDVIDRAHCPIADQRNMLFKGTHVVAGNAKALVVATGTATEIGAISKEIAAIDTEIPLKKSIRQLSGAIIVAVALISVGLFAAGLAFGNSAIEMFSTVVSLSVSIIPEGLPIVMTLVLATGVWRMSKRNALIKRLHAVEALGQANIILVDKTGTVTKNELVVQKAYINGKIFEVGGVGYEPEGDVRLAGSGEIDPLNHHDLLFAGKVAAFCSTARVAYLEKEGRWQAFGDPTEAALFVFAQKLGFHKNILEQESPQVAEIPFDYKNRFHATVHEIEKRPLLTVIGAPEVILGLSEKIREYREAEPSAAKERPLTKKDAEEIEAVFSSLSGEGLRVLALAIGYSTSEHLTPESVKNLTFVGMVGMKDALRPEVHGALLKARDAGIRVAMITGDHKKTAEALAREAGIWNPGDEVLTGVDIDDMTDEHLSQKLGSVSVFARVTPEHKLRIVKAYKLKNDVVAMTGDGVNDAPSLVAADLGVAMGKTGTEVAKEASDIVLLDDDFGNIVSAVEEGRNIYKTIKKVILYLFSTSAGEVLTISAALFVGLPLPILPAQIIWLNLVTDGFLDVALAMEPKEEGLLRGSTERPKKRLVDNLMLERMAVMAIPMMVGTLVLFSEYVAEDMTKAWTVALTTLAVFQWFNAWNCRHETKSVFEMNPFGNKYLIAATATTIALQLVAVYTPIGQALLRTTPLSLSEWMLIIATASTILVAEELRKLVRRAMVKRPALAYR